jgi:hypothetical protein
MGLKRFQIVPVGRFHQNTILKTSRLQIPYPNLLCFVVNSAIFIFRNIFRQIDPLCSSVISAQMDIHGKYTTKFKNIYLLKDRS